MFYPFLYLVVVSDVCQINEVDHLMQYNYWLHHVSDVCQINEVDHHT